MSCVNIFAFYAILTIFHTTTYSTTTYYTTIFLYTPPYRPSHATLQDLLPSYLLGTRFSFHPQPNNRDRYSFRWIATASMHATNHIPYLLLVPLNIIAPTPAAAMATPLSIATPSRPSLATLSSMRPLRLPACRFDGSWSRSRSLYLRASA